VQQVYDVDRDGFISLSDLETIVKHLVGSSLNEEQVAELITRAMVRTGRWGGESGRGLSITRDSYPLGYTPARIITSAPVCTVVLLWSLACAEARARIKLNLCVS
jgi:hypothetical protein